jgi:hypothetical protein
MPVSGALTSSLAVAEKGAATGVLGGPCSDLPTFPATAWEAVEVAEDRVSAQLEVRRSQIGPDVIFRERGANLGIKRVNQLSIREQFVQYFDPTKGSMQGL